MIFVQLTPREREQVFAPPCPVDDLRPEAVLLRSIRQRCDLRGELEILEHELLDARRYAKNFRTPYATAFANVVSAATRY